jgi:formylmethanofuran dehydrogenase subunit E
MKQKTVLILTFILIFGAIFTFINKKNQSEWYYPSWAQNAKYNKPIKVLDTESALGRYASKTKEISLKDLALIHGHLCDGLVISYIEISAVLKKLFPDGIFDRTDLVVVSKNGPCWVDTAAMMTGARTNFGTLSIVPEIGDGFIIQRISTGEAYKVHLKPNVFPKKQAELENKIRTARKQGEIVNPKDIDRVEDMQNKLSKRLLNTAPEVILQIEHLPNYKFNFQFSTGKRGDIINKNAEKSR